MKISEAKNGKVRYTESKVASGKSKPKTCGGHEKLSRDEPDFMEYLSEKDRRKWNRLSDSEREKILRKAQNTAAYREALRRGKIKETGQGTAESSGQDTARSGQKIRTGSMTAQSHGTRANTASETYVNEVRVNSSKVRSRGFIGIAALAAKRTAAKISKALKGKSEQLLERNENNSEAGDQDTGIVKTVTNPIKRTAGALFSILAMIIGPFFFVVLLVIILIVIIVFIIAWLISILFPAASRHGDFTGSGLMPYYCQQDPRWSDYPFNGASIGTDGCGMTSMAMIVACLTGDFNIIPPTIVDTGYNTVISHSAQTAIASIYGITDIEQMSGPAKSCCGGMEYDLAYIQDKIADGCPILVSMEGSYLNVTTNGHYFVLYGSGENGVYIYDPATLGTIYRESIEGGGSDWNAVLHDAKHIWIFPAPQLKVENHSNAEKIFKYLVSEGWSKEAAAGAIGNFYQDAGDGGTKDIDPASYGSGSWGETGGIACFTDSVEEDNFTALKEFASEKGKEWTDLRVQCEFLIHQMSHGKWWGAYYTPTCVEMNDQGYTVELVTYEEFTKMTDVNEAAKAFLCFYEDCGYEKAHFEDVRLPMALQAYEAWGK